ncbi:serine/arginine repetitive matrix protein 1-like [Drosophila miranda]|uniref:serine/arginine repetitive matrix protein 1-like n=1 Tax=Drosophila miranda TaxID=7229 RepID=UPI00143F7C87|nr:serine/arginine repetitive matrix protein 1-like [Drosophila miranda]
MNATENTPAKAHQRAAASAESLEVVDLTDFSDAEEPESAAKADEEAAPKPGVAEEPHTSDGDMYADMELDADEAGAADHEGPRDSPRCSPADHPGSVGFRINDEPRPAPRSQGHRHSKSSSKMPEFEDAGYHQRRDPRTGRGIYRPERGLERYTPKPYNAYYDDGESEEEEPYGRQFIAETETFHHTVTPWGLRVTRNHQMSVDVFVPPGRNVNAFFRTFREAAEPIDYRSEPAAPARASPPHAEARPPTPASDPPRCPNPPEESAAATPPHAEARPPTPASDPPRCPNPQKSQRRPHQRTPKRPTRRQRKALPLNGPPGLQKRETPLRFDKRS